MEQKVEFGAADDAQSAEQLHPLDSRNEDVPSFDENLEAQKQMMVQAAADARVQKVKEENPGIKDPVAGAASEVELWYHTAGMLGTEGAEDQARALELLEVLSPDKAAEIKQKRAEREAEEQAKNAELEEALAQLRAARAAGDRDKMNEALDRLDAIS